MYFPGQKKKKKNRTALTAYKTQHSFYSHKPQEGLKLYLTGFAINKILKHCSFQRVK